MTTLVQSHAADSPLWTGDALPPTAAMPFVEDTRFTVIKAHEPDRDGYRWLKGVALARHEDRWVASFGHNRCAEGEENTETEVANLRISDDGGATWGALHTLDAAQGDLGISHGVFLTHNDRLWAFQGAFRGQGRPGGQVHTRAYVAAPGSVRQGAPAWQAIGVVAKDGFWPLQEPQRMENGRYIVAGVSVGGGERDNTIPAVALVDGQDLTCWEVVKLPASIRIWGEATVLVHGSHIRLIARSNGAELNAFTATSDDYGHTWSSLNASNLPMAASKPYAGILSDGRPYLINTIGADVASAGRNPLCILIGAKGGTSFRHAGRVIDSRYPPAGAAGYTRWAYPYAVEWDGRLWIGFYMGTEGKHRSGAAGLVSMPVRALYPLAKKSKPINCINVFEKLGRSPSINVGGAPFGCAQGLEQASASKRLCAANRNRRA